MTSARPSPKNMESLLLTPLVTSSEVTRLLNMLARSAHLVKEKLFKMSQVVLISTHLESHSVLSQVLLLIISQQWSHFGCIPLALLSATLMFLSLVKKLQVQLRFWLTCFNSQAYQMVLLMLFRVGLILLPKFVLIQISKLSSLLVQTLPVNTFTELQATLESVHKLTWAQRITASWCQMQRKRMQSMR